MNANEVIANRAIEILGGKKGDYSVVNPMIMLTADSLQMMLFRRQER